MAVLPSTNIIRMSNNNIIKLFDMEGITLAV